VFDENWWAKLTPWTAAGMGSFAGVLLFGMVSMPNSYYLHLSPEGLTIQYVAHHRFYAWHEIRDFRIGGYRPDGVMPGNVIVFNLADQSRDKAPTGELCRSLLGYDVSLMATYEKSPAEIVQLLQVWQSRYQKTEPIQLSES